MSYENSWGFFFKPGERIVALPCWRKPRLYIVSHDWKQRWDDSAFYPAFKFRAKLFKLAVRVIAAAGLLPAKKGGDRSDFNAMKSVAGFDRLALLVGTQGPSQKLIARCLDESGAPTAYIKYGEKPLAVEKIKQETILLKHLSAVRLSGEAPADAIVPQVLWCGATGDGEVLIVSAMDGKMESVELPETQDGDGQLAELGAYLEALQISAEGFEVDEHPAIVRLREQVVIRDLQFPGADSQAFEKMIAPLRTQKWPVVIQHGDFAPWNVLRISEGRMLKAEDLSPPSVVGHQLSELCAIDWEEGTAEGFPYFDLIYYVLQTAFLVHKWSPEKAFKYARTALEGRGIDKNRGCSLIRLAMLDAYIRFGCCAADKDNPLQQFRLAIIHLELSD